MKISLFYISFFFLFLTQGNAQKSINLGLGYFGETLTHPGVLTELELEYKNSEFASLPLRLNLGYYSHPRNHNGLFLDVQFGFRRYFKSGFYLEEGIGIGVLQTILNGEDGVYEIDENGNVGTSSKFNQPDFMPSINLGLGWNLTKEKERQILVWLRPKLFWQFPQKITAVYHLAVQVGVSVQISK